MGRSSKRKQPLPPSSSTSHSTCPSSASAMPFTKPHHWLRPQVLSLLSFLKQEAEHAKRGVVAEIEDQVIDLVELLLSGRGTAVLWGRLLLDLGEEKNPDLNPKLSESRWREVGEDTLAELKKQPEIPFRPLVLRVIQLAQAEQRALRSGRKFGLEMRKKMFVRLLEPENRELGRRYEGKNGWSASDRPRRAFPTVTGDNVIYHQILPRHGFPAVDVLLDASVIREDCHAHLHWLFHRDACLPLTDEERQRFDLDRLYRELRGGGIVAVRFEFEGCRDFEGTARRMRGWIERSSTWRRGVSKTLSRAPTGDTVGIMIRADLQGGIDYYSNITKSLSPIATHIVLSSERRALDLHLSLVEPLLPALAEDLRLTTHRLHLPPVSRFGAAVQGQLAIAWTAKLHWEAGDDAPLTTASGWGGTVPLPPGAAHLVLGAADGGRGIVLATGAGAGVIFNGVTYQHGTVFRWGVEGEEEDFWSAMDRMAAASKGKEEGVFDDVADVLLDMDLLDIEEPDPSPPSPPPSSSIPSTEPSPASAASAAKTLTPTSASVSAADLLGLDWATDTPLDRPLGSRRLKGAERDRGICVFMKERVERRQESKAAVVGGNMPLGFGGGGRFSTPGFLDPSAPTDGQILSRQDHLLRLKATSPPSDSPVLLSALEALAPNAPLVPLVSSRTTSRPLRSCRSSTGSGETQAAAGLRSRIGTLVRLSGDRDEESKGTGAATVQLGETDRRLTRRMTAELPNEVKQLMVDLAGESVW